MDSSSTIFSSLCCEPLQITHVSETFSLSDSAKADKKMMVMLVVMATNIRNLGSPISNDVVYQMPDAFDVTTDAGLWTLMILTWLASCTVVIMVVYCCYLRTNHLELAIDQQLLLAVSYNLVQLVD